MARPAKYVRKSFFIDAASLRRARKVLRARSDADAVRISIERVAEMESFWNFMEKSRRSLPAGSMERP